MLFPMKAVLSYKCLSYEHMYVLIYAVYMHTNTDNN